MEQPVKIGVIGCGKISGTYLQNLKALPGVEPVACADLYPERAREAAARHGIPRWCTVEELLEDPEIELVLNLTVPLAHAEVSLKALEAGKHVYVEKPLAVTLEDGRRILETAERNGLHVGAAPDTFLGGGIQTCRRLIEEGAIGVPHSAAAFLMSRGHEHWHPSPEFFYQKGGGPMLDMGPYYLTALVTLLGPIRSVGGMARITFPQRVILSEPKKGQVIDVEVPTHVAGLIGFASGAIGTIITSFDIAGGSRLPHLEIHGSEGTLSVPDPNTFGGPVLLRKKGASEWREVPIELPHTDESRGIGVADMARAIRSGAAHRASGRLAFHVLEAMHGFHESSDTGQTYRMTSSI